MEHNHDAQLLLLMQFACAGWSTVIAGCCRVFLALLAVLQEEMAMAAASRRMSVAPVNRAASNIRNMSGRHGSMFYGRSTFVEGK